MTSTDDDIEAVSEEVKIKVGRWMNSLTTGVIILGLALIASSLLNIRFQSKDDTNTDKSKCRAIITSEITDNQLQVIVLIPPALNAEDAETLTSIVDSAEDFGELALDAYEERETWDAAGQPLPCPWRATNP